MKIVGICGEPATGKSTLMREIMGQCIRESRATWTIGRYGTLDYCVDTTTSMYVLGSYTGQDFDGTDQLSMAVINDAKEFLTELRPNDIVLFEGDRLFCDRFIGAIIKRAQFMFVQLHTSAGMRVRVEDRQRRGIQQNIEFLKGRRTKYQNLRSKYPFFQVWKNDDPADMQRNARAVIDFIAPF